MNKAFAGVILITITTAAIVAAEPPDPFAALGIDRSSLSPEQIRARSERLEASTTFSLLRFPAARQAPGRIFHPDIWSIIERAAEEYALDPMLLAGMIFIESYGDALAKSPTGPAGIAQLTKGSAKELGLLVGKRVKIGSRTIKRTRVIGKGKSRRTIVETRQQPIYKTIDERYVPERAIRAMARRVSNRRAWLGGKLDFAVAEYHMGAGRMAKLLSAHFGRTIRVSEVTAVMAGSDLSYPELFWTNTPYFRPAVYQALEDLTQVDYSPTYYFRVRQAMKLLDRYRLSPADYLSAAAIYQGRLGRGVLPNWQSSFLNEADAAPHPIRSFAELQHELGDRFVSLPDIAFTFGVRPPSVAGASHAVIAAERSTIGSALFVAHQLKRLQGERYAGFRLGNMLMHEGEGHDTLPMHSLGWAFDIPAGTLSKTEKRDLKFVLTDLRHAGLLAYVEEGKQPILHVVRHPHHATRFEQFYWDVMAGLIPATEVSVGARPNSSAQHVTAEAGVSDVGRKPRMLMALSHVFSRVFSFFARHA